MKTRTAGWLVLALLMASGGWAQEPEEAGGLVEDEDRARIEWADDLRYDPDEAVYYLSGNVVFSHQDITLHCDEAVYDYDDNSAVATGNPRVVNPETTITGTVIEADFDDEVATITQDVTVVTQRKQEDADAEGQDEQQAADEAGEEAAADSGQEAAGEAAGDEDDEEPRELEDYWEKKTTITCERIVYEYAEDVKRVTATGRVKAVQEDKTVYADTAVYEELKDLITLTGNVRVLTEHGDEFRCPRAVISVEENWVRAEQVTGVGRRRDEDEQSEETSEAGEAEGTSEAEEAPSEAEEPPAEGEGG